MYSPFLTSKEVKALCITIGATLLLGTVGCEFRDRDDKVVKVEKTEDPGTVGMERALDQVKEIVRLFPPGPGGYSDEQIHNLFRLYQGPLTEDRFLELVRSLDTNHDHVISPGDISHSVGNVFGPEFLDPPESGIYTVAEVDLRLRNMFPTARPSVIQRLRDRLMQYDEPLLGGDGDGLLTRPEVLVASAFVTFGSRIDLWNAVPGDVSKIRDPSLNRAVEDKIILSELKTRVLEQYWTNFASTPVPPEFTILDDLNAEQGLLALRGDRAEKYAAGRPAELANDLSHFIGGEVYARLMGEIYNRREFGGDDNAKSLTPFEALSIEMDVQWARQVLAARNYRFIPEAVSQSPVQTFVSTCEVPASTPRRILRTVGESLFTVGNRSRLVKVLERYLLDGKSFEEYGAVFALFFARLTNVTFELFAGSDQFLSKEEAKEGLFQLMGDLADNRMINYLYGNKRQLTPIDFYELLFQHLYRRLQN